MPSPMSQRIDVINVEVAALLQRAHSALASDTLFTVEQVRALSRPISEMAAILAAAKLAPRDAHLSTQLETYKAQLRELHPLLEQLRQNLLAKRSQLSSGQAHFQAVSRWASALGNTNDM